MIPMGTGINPMGSTRAQKMTPRAINAAVPAALGAHRSAQPPKYAMPPYVPNRIEPRTTRDSGTPSVCR